MCAIHEWISAQRVQWQGLSPRGAVVLPACHTTRSAISQCGASLPVLQSCVKYGACKTRSFAMRQNEESKYTVATEE
eukprot:6190489-Pleurochrysis_carterae.AAC.2